MSIDISKRVSGYKEVLREYCQLASRKELCQQDADRLAEILALAETNRDLTFLLNEADHFMGHDLGLLETPNRRSYKDQQAKLREYLGLEQQSLLEKTFHLAQASTQSGVRTTKHKG